MKGDKQRHDSGSPDFNLSSSNILKDIDNTDDIEIKISSAEKPRKSPDLKDDELDDNNDGENKRNTDPGIKHPESLDDNMEDLLEQVNQINKV